MGGLTATRLYASSIAIVSGVYSLAGPVLILFDAPGLMDEGLGLSGWIMAGLGIIVLIHGIVLLTPYAERLDRASGALMLVWAVIMLVNQFVLATASSMMARMGWDPGMVAMAILMLISGLIMLRRPSEMSM